MSAADVPAPALRRIPRRAYPPAPVRWGLLPFVRVHRRLLGRGLLFSCLLVGARLALPLPLTAVVDSTVSSGGGSGSAGWVAVLSTAFVAVALLAGFTEHHQRLAFAHFAGRVVSDCRDAAIQIVQRDDGDPSGDLTTQVVGDSLRVKQGLKGVLNHITVNGLLVLGVCVALALTDLRLGAVQLVGALALVLVAVLGATRVARVAREHRHRETALAGSVHRLVVREHATQKTATLQALRDLDAESGDADIAMTRAEGLTLWAVNVLLVASAAIVLLVGAQMTQAGQMSPGKLLGVTAYLLVLHGPATRLARQVTHIAPLLVSARELGGVLTGRARPFEVPAGRRSRSLRRRATRGSRSESRDG